MNPHIINSTIDEMQKFPEIREILEHDLFHSMIHFRHHGNVSCYEHTMIVAVKTFIIAKNQNLDFISATRGALLHDFYLYDWHINSPGLHGFKHPYISLKNAKEYFPVNKIEKDAIKRHMWPLTPVPPKYPTPSNRFPFRVDFRLK